MIFLDVLINIPKDKSDLFTLQKNASYIKALLIIKKIEKLKVNSVIKKEIFKKIISKLEKENG